MINTKEEALKLINEGRMDISEQSDKLLDDTDLMLRACSINIRNLQKASKSLKGNEDFILSLIFNDESAFGYADNSLQNDIEFAKKAIACNPDVYFYLPFKMVSDREIALLAASRKIPLKYIDANFYTDKEIVIASLNSLTSEQSYLLLSIKMQEDKDVFEAYINSIPKNKSVKIPKEIAEKLLQIL